MIDLKGEDDRLFAEKTAHTGKISESCRYIGFGLVALYYGLATTEPTAAASPPAEHWSVFWIGLFGVLTLIFDYLQYLGAYFAVKCALKNESRNYSKRTLAYQTWEWAFWVKQFAAMLGAVMLAAWVLR